MTNPFYCLTINGNSLDIRPGETILECAYRNNIKIKYYCGAGHCGRCKLKLISGEVKLEHTGGISRQDIANGFILTCCSFAKSDIAI